MGDRPLPEPRWHVGRDHTGEVHVTPLRDLIDHPPDTECVCGPTAEPVTRHDGSMGWVHTHHSLDGRERHEQPTTRRQDHTGGTHP